MVKRLIYLNKLKMINNISIYNFKDKYKVTSNTNILYKLNILLYLLLYKFYNYKLYKKVHMYHILN